MKVWGKKRHGLCFSRMGARTKPALLPTTLMCSFFVHILHSHLLSPCLGSSLRSRSHSMLRHRRIPTLSSHHPFPQCWHDISLGQPIHHSYPCLISDPTACCYFFSIYYHHRAYFYITSYASLFFWTSPLLIFLLLFVIVCACSSTFTFYRRLIMRNGKSMILVQYTS